MAKYKKIAVPVEAYQWFIGMESTDVIPIEPKRVGDTEFVGKIKTLEDVADSFHYVRSGDYIVRSNNNPNDVWAVKQDIFESTYEIVFEDEIIHPDYNC